MVVYLPNELILYILGSFAQFNQETYHSRPSMGLIYTPDELENRDTLLACSRVCRRWRQLAVPCLLRTLSLRFSPVESYQRDTARTHLPHRTPTELLSLIESYPVLQRSLEELRLTCGDHRVAHRHPCDTVVFGKILDQLPHLRKLQLVNLVFSHSDLSPINPGRRLDRLEIFTGLQADGPSPLLCLFDYIGTLCIESDHWYFLHEPNNLQSDNQTIPNDIPIPPLHIESLVLSDASAARFAFPSLLAALVKPVTYLELATDMNRDGFNALNGLWNQLSPHLDTVVLLLCTMFFPTGPAAPSTLEHARIFDLSRCTRVKSVVLAFTAGDEYQWQALHEMLCCLHNSPSLRQLTVRPSFRWRVSLSDVQLIVDSDLIQNVGTELLKLKRAKRVNVNITLSGRGTQDTFSPRFDEEDTISEDDMMSSLFPQLVNVD